MTAPLTQWRRQLADRVAGAVGWDPFDHPPPSLTPPAVVILAGANYLSGPRQGCTAMAMVTVRLVTDVHESSGAYDALDDAVNAALSVLPAWEVVNVGARTYGESRYLVADITVPEAVAIEPPLVQPRAVRAVPSERG